MLDNPDAPVPLSRADAYSGALTHPVSYFKGAYGNTLLRDQVLGPERFDEAFRKYISEWAFKHPSPSDFFRTMESEGGEDLTYFWRGWYMNNWTLDLAVEGASYVGGDAKNGLTVTVANKRSLVLPATLEVTYSDGSKDRMRIPAEAWLSKGTANFTFQKGKTAVTARRSILITSCRMTIARIIRSESRRRSGVRLGSIPSVLWSRSISVFGLSQSDFFYESETLNAYAPLETSCHDGYGSSVPNGGIRAGSGWRQG